jgi:hypothetical protein
MAGGGDRGGSGSDEGRAHGWQCVTWEGATGPKEATHARGDPEVKQGGGLPAAATAARENGEGEDGRREGAGRALKLGNGPASGDDSVMLQSWYDARGWELANGPPDQRGARPAGTARAVR